MQFNSVCRKNEAGFNSRFAGKRFLPMFLVIITYLILTLTGCSPGNKPVESPTKKPLVVISSHKPPSPGSSISPTSSPVRKKIKKLRPRKFSKKDYEKLAQINKSIFNNPDAPDPYIQRAELYLENHNLDKAEKDIKRADKLDHTNTGLILARVKLYALQKNFSGAVEECDRLLRMKPDSAEGYRIKGLLFIQKDRDLKGGLKYIQKAVELDPKDYKNYLALKLIYMLMGKYQKAVECMDKAVALAPDNPDVYYMRGKLRKDVGDLDGAVKDFDKLIKLQPDGVAPYMQKASVLEKSDKKKQALKVYETVIKKFSKKNSGAVKFAQFQIKKLKQK
ncbi:MAG: tetratricopeptide repeat protein [Candidatus Eremiobacteraeota bacterium]|nr:tetratricopeptide repeat protein [Candidatus Eremiobacteraeota bacterium]